ncbi:MAG: ATP-dependent DNA helicase [Candidatus Nanoarchaeia archaeon]
MGYNELLNFFPFDEARAQQKEFIIELASALEQGKGFVAHAPTGIGKTAAVLTPVISYALKNNKNVFFLTSRQTQHKIALETLEKIKEKNNIKLGVTDIIGRKWTCAQPHVDKLYSGEFYEFCKSLREGEKCEFYNNTKNKNKLTTEAKKVINELGNTIKSNNDLVKCCEKSKLCPYEIAINMASNSEVVVADYYYLFHPSISNLFLSKTGKEIEESIIIVDEAHNLPARLMEQATAKLSSVIIKRAISEARKFKYEETIQMLNMLMDILVELTSHLRNRGEDIVKKQTFSDLIGREIDISQLADDLEYIADEIREKQKQSYIGSVASFLYNWLEQPEEGFARIISISNFKGERITELSNNCLDPSVLSREIIQKSTSTILMSGTLVPPRMYTDILGFGRSMEKTYLNPFPKKNQLNLIVPKTTTKFSKRNEEQFSAMAEECAKVTDSVKGNSIIFFPSYYIRDRVAESFKRISKKTILFEGAGMSAGERDRTLEKFREYSNSGAVLLGVVSGSFYEGIDLPGELLKCVVIVGLPFQQPDLKTKKLIEYYDKKFGKGWDYGYVFPAFNKTLQSAGRCIRSETDEGVIVFLDERYLWSNYKRCFPKDMELQITKDPAPLIRNFFGRH